MGAKLTAEAPSLGWALVKPTLTSEEYMPVEVVRVGKRFTFVRTSKGDEWRYPSRGLWTVASQDAAYAEIEKMRECRRALTEEQR